MLDEYVQRYIITSNIYTLALEIMRAEKEEISVKDRSHYNDMLKMLPRLFKLYDDLEKITVDRAFLSGSNFPNKQFMVQYLRSCLLYTSRCV